MLKKIGLVGVATICSAAFITSCDKSEGVDVLIDESTPYALNYGTNECSFTIKNSDVTWANNIEQKPEYIELSKTIMKGKTISSIKRMNDKTINVTFTGNIENSLDEPKDIKVNINNAAFSGKKIKSAASNLCLFKNAYVNTSSGIYGTDTKSLCSGTLYGATKTSYSIFADVPISNNPNFSKGFIKISQLNDNENIQFLLHDLVYTNEGKSATSIDVTITSDDLKIIYTSINNTKFVLNFTHVDGTNLVINSSVSYIEKVE